jgi:hypothetical protein
VTTTEHAVRSMLRHLDAALEREIMRLRTRYQLTLDEFRGLYVSDQLVDALLRQVPADLTLPPRPPAAGPERWQRLVAEFDLTPLDEDLLLLVAAPELDAKYPPLYAYLNDDAVRRQPTADLAVRLFGDDGAARQAVRERLAPGAPLLAGGLVRRGQAWPEAAAPLILAPVATAWLLGLDAAAAAGLDQLACPATTGRSNASIGGGIRPVIVVEGPEASGRAALAAATAGCPVLRLTPANANSLADHLDAAVLAARLSGAALLIVADAVDADPALPALAGMPLQLFVAILPGSPLAQRFGTAPLVVLRPVTPPRAERQAAWAAALAGVGVAADDSALAAVAGRFRLPHARIERAAREVAVAVDGTASPPSATPGQLMAAARRQCAIDLGSLAMRVPTHAGWDDLVVGAGLRAQLRDFANAVATRERVFGEWGFGTVGRGSGHGLAALFAGVSGTGKTMSAAVIARETGLDLWRIDLSAAVSKYIGARVGDAILFFDEADALFGKRSEVKDAHDRYANIEVAYLLQRLEEHDGVVILASNFSRNIDQAFMRRLHYNIEFSVPDAPLREKLWRKALPSSAPLGGTIDYAFLARQFAFPGGDIRAAVLDAAFSAASDGGALTMTHLLHAVSRQLLKQGKLPMASAFGEYRGVLANGHAEPVP